MDHLRKRDAAFWIAAAGLLALTVLLGHWWISHPGLSAPERIAAVISAALFAGVGLRFAPVLARFWSNGAALADERAEKPKAGFLPKLFLALLCWDILVVLLAWPLRCLLLGAESLNATLHAWVCADGVHYYYIARDWYQSTGEMDSLVRLVFLPGYPVLVRAVHLIVRDWTCAMLVTSGLCFAGAGCALYRLLRLDVDHRSAVRGVALLCLTPGSFFFAAPMSESLFLLCCVLCVYFARTNRWLIGCVFGALAAFTRSLGVTLVVPLLTELIARMARSQIRAKHMVLRCVMLLIIPLGFGGYLLINQSVAGNPFQFLIYQHEHWHQGLGLFFHTASYQTDYAIATARDNVPNFLGLWLPNLLAQGLSLGLMIYGAKHLRASYTAWYFVYFVIAIGATWLLSAPRYLMAFFPMVLVLTRLTEQKSARAAVIAVMAILWILYFWVFLLRWQVF